ncbi:MAG TPA: phosphoribosylanthranilate isomerase [Burkholderiaceae bacterium]
MSAAPALWIKICGLRTVADVEAAAAAGANAVGFVFHAASPRNIALAAARDLQQVVPHGVERVAVFLHPAQALLDAVLEALRPDWVQTDVADLTGLQLPQGQRVLPVLRSGAVGKAPPARFLFESAHSGSGETADWDTAAQLARTSELVLAGGLEPSNVAAAIAHVRPFGVDVSSGVESSRGVKDPARIREFVSAARATLAPSAG